jgi:uncharacterized membrane protein YfcA
MTFSQGLLLFAASLAAGIINSVAGGGSFFTLPALIFVGIPSVAANATSTVAVWPGTMASVGAYRADIYRERRRLPWLLGISVVGGLIGAIILLRTPQADFDRVLPWLLLAATAIFAFGAPLTRWLRARDAAAEPAARIGFWSGLTQFVIAIYGGYFGGGAGMLMLAMLGLSGMTDIHAMNGLKTLLSATLNLVAIVAFIWAGLIAWPQAGVMVLGAVAGGYGGAYFARKMDPRLIRILVIVVGVGLTICFFLRRR